MGLYYTTYLCNGKFDGTIIYDKIQIAKIDPIIDSSEWQNNVVDINEMKRFLNKFYKNIIIKENEESDLFLAEYQLCTLSNPPMETVKYITIKNNTSYISNSP
jgi:hypothetical protein